MLLSKMTAKKNDMKKLTGISLTLLSAFAMLACSGPGDKDNSKDNAMTAVVNSGNDLYYEYNFNTVAEKNAIKGYMKLYLSAKGDARFEMDMHRANEKQQDAVPMTVLIGHANQPDQSIIIDDAKKTYTVHHIDPDDFKTGLKEKSTVTKIGEEKILGFNCVHVKIIIDKGLGSLFRSPDTLDIWKSPEVPLNDVYTKYVDKFQSASGNAGLYSADVDNQLKKMGCTGFIVKMVLHNNRSTMNQELTKVEHRDFAKSLFEIPPGYKEDKDNIFDSPSQSK